jgi:hypothetical protein
MTALVQQIQRGCRGHFRTTAKRERENYPVGADFYTGITASAGQQKIQLWPGKGRAYPVAGFLFRAMFDSRHPGFYSFINTASEQLTPA